MWRVIQTELRNGVDILVFVSEPMTTRDAENMRDELNDTGTIGTVARVARVDGTDIRKLVGKAYVW